MKRRDFLKMGWAFLGGMALDRLGIKRTQSQFPDAQRLGRVAVGMIERKVRPDIDSATNDILYQDAVVPWMREVVGRNPSRINQRWVETPDGYIWSTYLQPVRNQPNSPLTSLPNTSLGEGMWVEVSVPWVDLVLENPPARSPWLDTTDTPRLYYSQILWVDQIKTYDEGQVWYRVNERYGYGDRFWAAAEAFRQISEDELEPINPDVSEKRVVVNLNDQTLACEENGREVYFCRISSGAKYDASGNPVDKWATPIGSHPIWRKLISLHMSGGTTGGGYDLPGIGWTTLFAGNGVAVHSTFWHNNFGVPMSHGCVNARPEDAKWVFRWVEPHVPYDPGDVTIAMPGGTKVDVIED
jgi:lipoprotein-anchoring transpeptidase ErfK/SrfK